MKYIIVITESSICFRVDKRHFHREGGPAYYYFNTYKNCLREYKEWHLNGELHREDGPAIEDDHSSGNYSRKEWWYMGKRHREDGPAIEIRNYDSDYYFLKEWYINNKFVKSVKY